MLCHALMLASVLVFDRKRGAVRLEPRGAAKYATSQAAATPPTWSSPPTSLAASFARSGDTNRQQRPQHRRVDSHDAEVALRTGGRFPRARVVLLGACHLLAVAAAAQLLMTARASTAGAVGWPVRPATGAVLGAGKLAVALCLTHGLGGWLRFRDGWVGFYQPGAGGAAFVAVQMLAWTLAAVCLVALAFGALSPAQPAALVLAASTGLSSEVALAASLLLYRPRHCKEVWTLGVPLAPKLARWGSAALRAARVHLVIMLLYSSPWASLGVFVVPLLALPPALSLPWCVALALGTFPFYYFSRDAITGAREWPWLQVLIGGVMDDAASTYFKGIEVVRVPHDGCKSSGSEGDASGAGRASALPVRDAALPPRQYIFGFHPHALMPATAAWLKLTSAWRRVVPAARPPVTLAASPPFFGPILRDLLLWGGVRVVSSAVFTNILHQGKSVMLCPGGQTELLLQSTRDPCDGSEELVCDASRRGFLRKAIEAQVPVVPCFIIGERQLLHNLITWRRVQRLAYRTIGFPIPFVPVGQCGVLPLPRRVRMVALVGDPLPPPRVTSDASVAEHTQALDRFHAEYYDRLKRMYDKYRHLNASQPLRLLKDKAELEAMIDA